MAKVNVEKKYYNQIKEQVAPINENNKFYNELKNSIKAGKQEIYQKRIKESQVFDSLWIETIEMYMENLDKIVRNPRFVMQANEEVMRIERAKKITSRTISHLSAHTENVQTIRDDGVVVPSKILSTTYDDTLNTYENRFIKTLISKLAAFIEIRYNAVKDSITTYQSDRLNVNSTFAWRNYKVECVVDMKVTEEVDDELNRRNLELLKRIETLRMYVMGFVNSTLFKELRNTLPVTSPILRTNIILKNVDYNACLKLWQFMDSYRQLGVNVDYVEKNLDFDEAYENEIVNMLIYDYSAMVTNQENRAKDYHLKPFRFKQEKAPKVVENLVNENLPTGNEKMEAPSANEYFYQKTIDQASEQYEELIKSGKSYNQSLTTVYKKMQGISNSVYKELFTKLEDNLPEDATYSERKKAKFLFLKRKYSVMKSIAYIKEMEAIHAKKEVERLANNLEKFKKQEKEYQELLKKQRKEALAKAREARKNLPKTEKEKTDQTMRIVSMQAAKDRIRFEKLKQEQEASLMEKLKNEELERERINLENELNEKLEKEKEAALQRIEEEKNTVKQEEIASPVEEEVVLENTNTNENVQDEIIQEENIENSIVEDKNIQEENKEEPTKKSKSIFKRFLKRKDK